MHIIFWGQILKWVVVHAILKTSACLVWYYNDIRKKFRWGLRLVGPKIDFYFFCARISFLARAKFLRQSLVSLKTFVFDWFSIMVLIFSKNALVKMGLTPPPPPFWSYRHFCFGTVAIKQRRWCNDDDRVTFFLLVNTSFIYSVLLKFNLKVCECAVELSCVKYFIFFAEKSVVLIAETNIVCITL